jgi:phosphate transport system substrate-binding protein
MQEMRSGIFAIALVAALGLGCGEVGSETSVVATIHVDGSSTVFPITEAVAEEFQRVHRDVRVTVGISGTGGGFKRFQVGETDINDASRPIKGSERETSAAHGIAFIELPVAYDGISLVVNPENTFVDFLTVEELHRIWRPESDVRLWSDVRAGFPATPITLYAPGTDSGTFDYFTEVVNGEEDACRPDFTASEDDNILVQGVSGDPHALAFFGYAYYMENRDHLKVVAVDPGDGAVAPSRQTIGDGTYRPLSRPIFIYVSARSANRPEIQAFVRFYLENAPELVSEVGYVPLPERVYRLALERFENGVTGSVFAGAEPGSSMEVLLGG